MLARFVSFALLLATSANAGIYVNSPVSTTICTVGQPCLVAWVDDGDKPHLHDIGETIFDLFYADKELVQTPIFANVDTTRSFTFIPDPSPPPPPEGRQYWFQITASDLSYQTFTESFTIKPCHKQ